jgi:calcyclin binding protein
MVAVEEIKMEESSPVEEESSPPPPPPEYQEKVSDADELEKLLSQIQRPTAKTQLELLVKKIRGEASALKSKPAVAAAAAAPVPVAISSASRPVPSPSATYTTIDRFAFDAGGSSDKFVTLYLPLPGVGAIKKNAADHISVDFGKDKFDFKLHDLNGKNYRLIRDNLEHDIVPDKSKYIVKADKIVVKLQKVKGEYGSFDYWSKLTDPAKKDKKSSSSGGGSSAKDNPTDGLMDMMKNLYDSGDDKMKKMIGETMLKQRNGELNKDSPPGMGDFGKGFDDDE